MKKTITLLLLFASLIFAQNTGKEKLTGKVDYISSQFYYITFTNTEGILIGDTLFIKYKKKYYPKFIVETKSSRTCAGKLLGRKVKKGRRVYAFVKKLGKSNFPVKSEKTIVDSEYISNKTNIKRTKAKKFKVRRQDIYGKYSLSGYSNFSNINGQTDFHHWRHSFSFYTNNFRGSRFSFSSYVTFRYRSDEWSFITSHIGHALKIYDLAVKYDFSKNTQMTFGRKINRKLSNIGAIDGLQLEIKYKGFILGGILGSRPNISDYGFNFKLLETGVYVSREDSVGNGKMTNTFSVIQQLNDFTTDRRFIYFQHSSNFVKNVYFFLSSEVDFFKHYHKFTSHEPYLTNIYASLRYRPVRWLSFSASYDARKNVIYYETYKSYIDRLIENATRQGFRLRINLRPWKYIFASVYSGYRFRKNDKVPSKNFGVSVTHSRVPFLKASVNLNYLQLNTNYLSGEVIGIRISKDLFAGMIYSTLGIRSVNYDFTNFGKLYKKIFMLDLSLRLTKKMSLSVSYEGSFEGKDSYSNLFFNITQRF